MSEDIKQTHTRFKAGVIRSDWSENGELTYVIKDGLNPEEYAQMAKKVLESEREIAHDFVGKVMNESGERTVRFQYNSGWFLEGMADPLVPE